MERRNFSIPGNRPDAYCLDGELLSSGSSAVSLLVVEGYPETGVALSHLLRIEGYQVHVAGTCSAAREIAARHDIDFVICELELPDGQGCDLMSELNTCRGLTGLAIVGLDRVKSSAELWDAGFIAALRKPIEAPELLDAVRHQQHSP